MSRTCKTCETPLRSARHTLQQKPDTRRAATKDQCRKCWEAEHTPTGDRPKRIRLDEVPLTPAVNDPGLVMWLAERRARGIPTAGIKAEQDTAA